MPNPNDNVLTIHWFDGKFEIFIGCNIQSAAVDLRWWESIHLAEHSGKLRTVGKTASVGGICAADAFTDKLCCTEQSSAFEIRRWGHSGTVPKKMMKIIITVTAHFCELFHIDVRVEIFIQIVDCIQNPVGGCCGNGMGLPECCNQDSSHSIGQKNFVAELFSADFGKESGDHCGHRRIRSIPVHTADPG